MSRGVLIRFFLVLGLLAGCVALAVNKAPNLGLDLRGGAQFVFQAEGTKKTPATAENVDKTIEVLRGRVDALGVSESTLVRQGENQILVELPGIDSDKEAQEAEAQIGKTAKLAVRPVVASVPKKAEPSSKQNAVLPAERGEYLEVGPVKLAGEQITGAAAEQPQNSPTWAVTVDFSDTGSDAFGELSGKAACAQGHKRRIAIALDGRVISSPEVQVPCGGNITGSTQITGNFTLKQANDLAVLIEGGALPLELELISSRLVGPTLGAEAIDASFEAGIIGLILTGLFIAGVYRLVGLMATLALGSYALLAYAMLLGLNATLTLPGLAGFVLAIGMAIDANVLVFERAREEYEAQPSAGLRRALLIGFNKAWTAIIDSNVTTLLAAALLFFLGSGPIKGFGVTLSIGVVASMISALIIARVLAELAVARKGINRHPGISGIGSVGPVRSWLERKDFDIMKGRKKWLAVSGVATVLAISGIFVNGLNLGVEFTGGRQLDYSVSKDISVAEARGAISDAGYSQAVVQAAETADFTVRTGEITDAEESKIAAALGEVGGEVNKIDDQEIGASLGEELRNKALIAFGVAFFVQLLYLAFRFKWTFGVAAVTAMFHDVLLVVGLFAWLQKPIDGIFLAAAMTIIGLSVNDTVVVFDRVRERWHGSQPGEKFQAMANKAAVETIPRTINTGLGTMFILAALAVLGGDSLRDFSIALLVGLIVGTYSSIFTAAPMVTYLQEKWPMSRVKKEKPQRDPNDSGAVV